MISTPGSLGRRLTSSLERTRKRSTTSSLIKAPQITLRLSVSCHRPRPPGPQGRGPGDLERFQKGNATERQKLYLAVIVAAELGEGTDQALRRWKQHSRNSPRIRCCTTMPPVPTPWHLRLLPGRTRRRVVTVRSEPSACSARRSENGYADYNHMQEDADLDPLRELPAFVEIMKAGHLDRSYAAVWTGDFRFEASPTLWSRSDRSSPAVPGTGVAGLSHGRSLGRPDFSQGPPITASVWHRPVITEETKDQLAERQARAAIALLRMGKAAEVLPLLRHSADPRLRSFIVNWLNPLGADPKSLPPNWTASRQPPSPRPPRDSSSWMRCCSTPRPRSGGR